MRPPFLIPFGVFLFEFVRLFMKLPFALIVLLLRMELDSSRIKFLLVLEIV